MKKSSLEKLVKRVCESEIKSITGIMTPLNSLTFLDVNDSREELLKKIGKSKRTFYPVCHGSEQNVVGIIHIKDLLIEALKDNEINFTESLHEPVYFNEDNNIIQVYNIFFQSNTGAAFIVDKLKNVIGFITLRDVIKALFGGLSLNNNL